MLRPTLVQALVGLSATHVFAEGIFEAMENNGMLEFSWAAQNVPSIVNASGPGQVIYSIPDSLFAQPANNTNNSPPLSALLELHSTNSNSSLRARDAAVSPGTTRQTYLDDPAFVNLGPGRSQVIVEKCAPGEVRPVVFSGLGAMVSVVGDDIPFDNGVIRPVDRFFTIPESLSETLDILSLNTLSSALNKTGLLTDIGNRAGITVFAPTSAALASAGTLPDSELAKVLQRHVLVGVTAYSPQLRDGNTFTSLAGQTLTISFKDGSYYINDAKIVDNDIILSNAVLHTIDKVLSPSATPTKSATATSTVVTGAAERIKRSGWSVIAWTLVGAVMAQVYGGF